MRSQEVNTKYEFSEEYVHVADSLKRKSGLNRILGQSEIVRELRKKIDSISCCKANVLISGESGTGKEVAARTIHYLSRRAGEPFVPVNCGAIPESLFENELFGHVKGAFTDAGLQQIGLIKEADGGTLFLDEIGLISSGVQAKLLRFLQDKEYRPLGGPGHHKADVRIIAATNTDLQHLVAQCAYRKDLFFRLNVVSLHMPPLRERREDIPILVEHFVNMYAKQSNKQIRGLTRDAMSWFMSYSWPGNIRELENKIQQAIVMCTAAVIDVEAIQVGTGQPEAEESQLESFNIAKRRVVDSFARTYLTQLLREQEGDVASAAKKAGKSRTGLWNLLKRYGIAPSQFRHRRVSEAANMERGHKQGNRVIKE
ncbi:MAG: sigma-54 interaction domain-containing protein [Planctomycetota bacterium]|jgi:DNA-binding NtrC family response regulator